MPNIWNLLGAEWAAVEPTHALSMAVGRATITALNFSGPDDP